MGGIDLSIWRRCAACRFSPVVNGTRIVRSLQGDRVYAITIPPAATGRHRKLQWRILLAGLAARFPERISFGIHLCPIADPFARYMYLEQSTRAHRESMRAKHLAHFVDEETMQKLGKLADPARLPGLDVQPNLVIVGTLDQNAPPCVTSSLKNAPSACTFWEMDGGGHELCYKHNKEVLNAIEFFVFMNPQISTRY